MRAERFRRRAPFVLRHRQVPPLEERLPQAFAAVAICRRHEFLRVGRPGRQRRRLDGGAGAARAGAARRLGLLDLAQPLLDLRLEPARRVVLDRAEEALAASSGNGRVQFPALTASLCRCTRS